MERKENFDVQHKARFAQSILYLCRRIPNVVRPSDPCWEAAKGEEEFREALGEGVKRAPRGLRRALAEDRSRGCERDWKSVEVGSRLFGAEVLESCSDVGDGGGEE